MSRVEHDFRPVQVHSIRDVQGLLPLPATDIPGRDTDAVNGSYVYGLFHRTIELDVVRRQQGQDECSIAFRTALEHLRD